MASRDWASGVLEEGGRVALCGLRRSDGRDFVTAALRSRRLHGRWAFPPADPATFRAYLTRLDHGEDAGLLVRRREDGELLGFLSVTNVVRGAQQSADLGWAAFAPHQGQGFMSEGLRLLFSYAFGGLGLHRLQASIQPENAASLALARACGMILEGFSPRYLYLAGRWRDHEHWAINLEDWRSLGRR